MIWALILTVYTGNAHSDFAVDRFRSASDCVAALDTTRNQRIYRNVARVEFACVKIAKR